MDAQLLFVWNSSCADQFEIVCWDNDLLQKGKCRWLPGRNNLVKRPEVLKARVVPLY